MNCYKNDAWQKKKNVCLEDMSLLAMNSLYKKGAMTGTYGSKHN